MFSARPQHVLARADLRSRLLRQHCGLQSTGVLSDHVIDELLRVKDNLSRFLTLCHVACGERLNIGGGFFNDCIHNGQLVIIAPHGAFTKQPNASNPDQLGYLNPLGLYGQGYALLAIWHVDSPAIGCQLQCAWMLWRMLARIPMLCACVLAHDALLYMWNIHSQHTHNHTYT